MNFRSKPRVVCPDIASGLFSRKPSRMESWTKQWLYLVLIQITSTDAAASGSDKLKNTQTWAVFSFLSQHTSYAVTTYIQTCWTLIYTDIKNCTYVDNRNNGFTKDCSLDHGSAIKDDSYSL